MQILHNVKHVQTNQVFDFVSSGIDKWMKQKKKKIHIIKVYFSKLLEAKCPQILYWPSYRCASLELRNDFKTWWEFSVEKRTNGRVKSTFTASRRPLKFRKVLSRDKRAQANIVFREAVPVTLVISPNTISTGMAFTDKK